MEELNLKKQKITYESKCIEGVNDFSIKGEYLIPDTHPDVEKILIVDVKPRITNTESFTDKIFVEGDILYSLIYVARDDEKNTYNISYSDKFNLYIEAFGMKKENLYDISNEIIDIKSEILNERKISVEGLIKFTSLSSEILDVETVCDLDAHEDDVQLLMKELKVCEVVGTFNEDLTNETIINIPMDKASVSKILLCDSSIYKTECKLLDSKIIYNAYCKIKVLYKGNGSEDLCYLEQDVYLTKEVEAEEVSEDMMGIDNWSISEFEYMVDEDESGESRLININVSLRCSLKVINNNVITAIDDSYSKNSSINMVKNSYKLNTLEDYNNTDIIVKDNVEVDDTPVNIVYSAGRCVIVDKKIVEGKITIDGVVKCDVIYKTNSEESKLTSFTHNIPFTTSFESESIKIDVDTVVKCNLESIDAFIEAKTIGIKSIVNVKVYVNCETRKDILVDMYKTQEEVPVKECSFIVYVVGQEDTLWGIAKKYCVSVEDICRINDLSQDENINGYKLLILAKAIF